MNLVTVKNKYQVVIPQGIRKKIGVEVGDLLEAKAENGRIVLEPRSLVDRAVMEGLEDLRQGRVYGPFATVDELLASLRAGQRAPKRRKRRRRK